MLPTVLDAEQVNYLIRYALDFEMHDHMGAPLANVVLGCLCGGMRRGEQLGVKWSDLQLPSDGENDGRVHICRQRVQSKAGAYEKTPKGGDDEGETPEETEGTLGSTAEIRLDTPAAGDGKNSRGTERLRMTITFIWSRIASMEITCQIRNIQIGDLMSFRSVVMLCGKKLGWSRFRT